MRIELDAEIPLAGDPQEAASRLRAHLARRRYRLEAPDPSGGFRAARGSAFSLHPEGLSRAVTAEPLQGALRLRLSARPLPWRARAHRLSLEGARAELRAAAAASPPSSLPDPPASAPSARPAAGRILLAGLAAGFLAFWIAGHHLLCADLDRIRAGAIAWDYHPEPEPLADLPASVPWCAAAFLGGTAGLAAGTFLSLLLWLSARAAFLAETTGSLLAWSSTLLVAALATGPGEAGIGLARSMLHPWALLPAALLPWLAHLLATLERPRSAAMAGGAASAAIAIALLAPAGAGAAEPPDLGESVRSLYGTHRFRDRYLLTNPVGGFWSSLYYRYTPYADLATSERLHPDRASLRLLRDAGVALWLYAVTTLGVGLLAWSLGRRAWRLGAAGRWGACASLCAVPLLLAVWLLRLVLAAVDIPLSAPPDGVATLLINGTDAERSEAAHALAAIGTPAEIPVLRGGLDDPDPRVRLWSVTALARLGDLGSLPPVLERMEDPHDLVRSRVYHALPYFARAAKGSPDGQRARAVLARLEPRLAAERTIYAKKQVLEARAAWRALLQ